MFVEIMEIHATIKYEGLEALVFYTMHRHSHCKKPLAPTNHEKRDKNNTKGKKYLINIKTCVCIVQISSG